MTDLRVLTVDDEDLAHRRLHRLLQAIPDVRHVGAAMSCAEAIGALQAGEVDVMLLDIRMRDGSGFDVVEHLPAGRCPAVIVVSAFDHYAVRAFDENAVDYVLKPVQLDRLGSAIDRARRQLEMDATRDQLAELRSTIANLREAIGEQQSGRYEREFWIRRMPSGFTRVPVDRIEWVSSEEDYIRLHTPEGSYLMRESVRGFESRVEPARFTRIHRRTLVRTNAIREIVGGRIAGAQVLLDSGVRLRAGRVYARRLKALVADRARNRPAGPIHGEGARPAA